MGVVPAALLVALCLLAAAPRGRCSIAAADRTRHRAHHAPPDVYVAQLETAAPRNCPNCLRERDGGDGAARLAPDHLRLEVIKKQILSKLGLRHKPNVTHVLPREVIERVYRTIAGEREVLQEDAYAPATSAGLEAVDADDYYGRTSEIIAFAEQGKRPHADCGLL